MSKYLLIICFILTSAVVLMAHRLKVINNELSVSISNNKAYLVENKSLEEDIRVYQFTVDQLNYFTDSIISEMNNVKEELRIKDKNLKALQLVKSEINLVGL